MARPSSTICRTTTTDSASKISSYYSNTSMLLFSSTIPSKRQRFITCSLDPISTSSTTSSSSSASQKGSYKNITNKKSLQVQRTKDGTFSVIHSDERKPSDQKKIKKSNKDETKKNGANMGLKSGPRKRRPLWQKLFFASKKVRSIILLNFITIVYASDIPVIKEVEAIMDPAVRFIMSAIPFLPFVFRSLNPQIAAMPDVSATETAIIYGMEPLWGVGFAWFLLGERWDKLGYMDRGCSCAWWKLSGADIFGPHLPKNLQWLKMVMIKVISYEFEFPLSINYKMVSLSTSPIVVRSKKDVTEYFK